MSNETETKHLRGKLQAWQLWAERQIKLGLMDVENMPACFERKKDTLKELIENDRTIGSHCHWCNHKFEPGEKKVTTNRIMWFHPGCETAYDKMENRTEKFENRDDL